MARRGRAREATNERAEEATGTATAEADTAHEATAPDAAAAANPNADGDVDAAEAAVADVETVAPTVEDNPNAEVISSLKMFQMFVRLGLTKRAAKFMVEEQTINSVDVLVDLQDAEIEKLCKVCRRSTNDGETKGIPVGVINETNFKLANFLLKYWRMTERPLNPDKITLTSCRAIKDFKSELSSREDPPPEEAPKLNNDKIFEFFESFREFLREHTGAVSGRPLAYVVREVMNYKPSDEDPAYGEPDSKYISYYDEIEHRAAIKRKPINGSSRFRTVPHFLQDNVKVWKLLYSALKLSSNLTYIKTFLKDQNGREAFRALHNRLLGSQAIDNYASKAENRLNSLVLDGSRKKGWGFEKYVLAHIEQHLILQKLQEYGHNGIDENSKKRIFQKGVTDPVYKPVRGACSTNPPETFDDLVVSYRTFLNTEASVTPQPSKQLNIAAISGTSGNRTQESGYPSGKALELKDKYDFKTDYSSHSAGVDKSTFYKGKAWANLTSNQRNYLRQQRYLKKKSKFNNNKRGNANISQLLTTLVSKVDNMEKRQAETGTSDSDSTADAPVVKKRTKIVRNKK